MGVYYCDTNKGNGQLSVSQIERQLIRCSELNGHKSIEHDFEIASKQYFNYQVYYYYYYYINIIQIFRQ